MRGTGMRWIAPCVASLVVATGVYGATATARSISPVGPAEASITNEKPAADASKVHPFTAGRRTSGAGAGNRVLLGSDAIAPAPGSTPAGRPASFPFADRRSGSVSSIHVFVDSRSRATSLVAGLYSNANGHPGSLLTVGALNHPEAGAWNSLRVGAVSVRSGHLYWLAVLARGGRLYFRGATNGGCSAQVARQTRMRWLQSSWTGRPDSSVCGISAYAASKGTKRIVKSVLSPVGSGVASAGGVLTGVGVTPTGGSPPTGGPPPTGGGGTTSGLLAPVNVVPPGIAGSPENGDSLVASNGTWVPDSPPYAYQWQDCDTSGGNCTNINEARQPTYTLQPSDVGRTIRVVVTASDLTGSASASSAATTVVSGLSCDLNATPSSLASQVAAASPGQAVCLASGDYSSFTGTSKPAPGITITAAPGATVTFNSGITLNLSSVQNFTLDGTAGGGTMTAGGELDAETSGDALQNKALNLTFQNIAFSASGDVLVQGPENSNVTFNRDTFVAGNAQCSGASSTGTTWQFILPYMTATSATPSGVTIENSVFVASGDLWNPYRAIQTASSMIVNNNVFVGYLDHLDSGSCNHVDTLQVYSRSNGTYGNITFTGNLCYDDYGCFMAFDGTSSNMITDNACFDIEQNCIILYSDSGSVLNHNTQQTDGADPSGCAIQPNVQPCTSSQLFENSNKSGDSTPGGETYTNNTDRSGPSAESGSLTSNTNNMWSGASPPNINGSPTFTGGSNPTTWAGFELSSGSTGRNAGSDGQSVGIRGSAGGPPTGGGSPPANTAAPTVTGTAAQGQTLATTDGSWMIAGGVPTATTYMWWDCPSSTFSPGSCTPIQPQTYPTSANNPTYTLGASDVGEYVFSEVTVTNANGQVNAISGATGPVG
jgi:hypothetical protein